MERKEGIPIWVFLAFSSIETRKMALMLVWGSLIFSLYCIPWSRIIPGTGWIGTLFLIDDWSWFIMMVPIMLWYWASLRWVDRHSSWGDSPREESGGK